MCFGGKNDECTMKNDQLSSISAGIDFNTLREETRDVGDVGDDGHRIVDFERLPIVESSAFCVGFCVFPERSCSVFLWCQIPVNAMKFGLAKTSCVIKMLYDVESINIYF